MKITHVNKGDVQDLKNISRKAIHLSVEADELIKKEIVNDTDKHIEKNLEATDCVFLKYKSKSISGFILVQSFWNLSDLFVVPDQHGKGIGSKLLNKAISVCELASDRSYIRVNSSTNAEGFYRKHGFLTFSPEKEVPGFVVPLIYHF